MSVMRYAVDVPFESPDFQIKVVRERSSKQNLLDVRSRAIHEAVEIKLFYEGSSTLIIDGNTVRADAGDTVIINPYEVHTTLEAADDNGKYHLLMIGLDFFGGAFADSDLKELFLAKQVKLLNLFKDDLFLRETILEIVEEWETRKEGYALAISGLVARLFVYLKRYGVNFESASHSEPVIKYYKIIEPALRKIRDGYASDFTVESLAEACFISKYHFCRIFKLCTGETPIQYLNKYRLKIADEMLKRTNSRIADVARASGFDSVSYFSKTYKKHFGHSPKGNKES